jgi:hypothetical protein
LPSFSGLRALQQSGLDAPFPAPCRQPLLAMAGRVNFHPDNKRPLVGASGLRGAGLGVRQSGIAIGALERLRFSC